ncbi:alpha/beta fold hydrolase [Paenibacillus allorhizosphaerae]|uniref:2-(Acetamidomethylene)succinate hydrolase n=1 Tax=Paenibacillus allorhizosphaerae TaxID=2849866 RepID=A0ABM8VRA3_9BACL|nr:alpha/beta hydrolase [Paenibacillus allorhizosphaerae]CAG7655087.1 2-(acetamidomethylene)succinate hydrolase [Paenibacillus allorhizosphaerae]
MLNSGHNDSVMRKYFNSGNLRLSYLDFGGDSEQVLVMLHGYMANARSFSELAVRFKNWRVISLDQRGHGWSDHPPGEEYARDDYVDDILNLVRSELGGQPVTILGHSLGGLNAYQFAARHSELVKAVIVEDIGAEIKADFSFADKLPFRSASLKELRDSLASVGLRAIDYFAESVLEDEHGWGFRTDLKGLQISVLQSNGVWWDDWLGSSCPILLIHGRKSFILDTNQAKRMEERRPNTKLIVFEQCGHGVHTDDLHGYYHVVNDFLTEKK